MSEANTNKNSLISELYNIETNLLDFTEYISDSNLELNKKNKFTNQIKGLMDIRSKLSDTLSTKNKNLNNIIDYSTNVADSQQDVTTILDEEIEEKQKNFNILKNEKNNNIRMTEINNYYAKKHNAQSNVMKTLLISCILVLLLTFIKKKELLPNNLVAILIGIIIFFGGLRISLLTLDIARRDNMNFDKYKWDFTPLPIPNPFPTSSEVDSISESPSEPDGNSEHDDYSSIKGHTYLLDGGSTLHDHEHTDPDGTEHTAGGAGESSDTTSGFTLMIKNGLPSYPWGKSVWNVKPYNSKM